MPAVPDRAPSEARPAVLGDGSDDVAFLEAPGLDADALVPVIVDALVQLTTGAVLTVYSTRVTAADLGERLGPHGIDLVHAVRHSTGGTTFIVR